MFDINAIVNAAITEAVNARITEVLQQHANTVAALAERIAALENNPAQGVDTSVVAGNYTPISNEQIKAALQEWATKDSLLEHLDNQEWFWEKLQNRIDSTVEAGIDDHTSTYDHDSYDNAVSDLEDRDYVTNDSLEDAVREAVGNLSFDISVS